LFDNAVCDPANDCAILATVVGYEHILSILDTLHLGIKQIKQYNA